MKSYKRNSYIQPSVSTDLVVPWSACCGYACRWDFVMVMQHRCFFSSCVSQLAVWISIAGRLHETAPGRCVTNTSSGRMDWYIGGASACSPAPVEERCRSSDIVGSPCTRLQHPYLIWWQLPYLASDFSILFQTVMCIISSTVVLVQTYEWHMSKYYVYLNHLNPFSGAKSLRSW